MKTFKNVSYFAIVLALILNPVVLFTLVSSAQAESQPAGGAQPPEGHIPVTSPTADPSGVPSGVPAQPTKSTGTVTKTTTEVHQDSLTGDQNNPLKPVTETEPKQSTPSASTPPSLEEMKKPAELWVKLGDFETAKEILPSGYTLGKTDRSDALGQTAYYFISERDKTNPSLQWNYVRAPDGALDPVYFITQDKNGSVERIDIDLAAGARTDTVSGDLPGVGYIIPLTFDLSSSKYEPKDEFYKYRTFLKYVSLRDAAREKNGEIQVTPDTFHSMDGYLDPVYYVSSEEGRGVVHIQILIPKSTPLTPKAEDKAVQPTVPLPPASLPGRQEQAPAPPAKSTRTDLTTDTATATVEPPKPAEPPKNQNQERPRISGEKESDQPAKPAPQPKPSLRERGINWIYGKADQVFHPYRYPKKPEVSAPKKETKPEARGDEHRRRISDSTGSTDPNK